jgi:hypothetical protein
MAWFRLGLTIVDGIDTLMIAGLEEEYQEVRGRAPCAECVADFRLWCAGQCVVYHYVLGAVWCILRSVLRAACCVQCCAGCWSMLCAVL